MITSGSFKFVVNVVWGESVVSWTRLVFHCDLQTYSHFGEFILTKGQGLLKIIFPLLVEVGAEKVFVGV